MIKRSCVAILLITTLIFSTEPPPGYDLNSFVAEGMRNDGMLLEKKFEKSLKELEVEKLKRQAILPKFEVALITGPAPGISQKIKTSVLNDRDTVSEVINDYNFTDWNSWGPFFGTELKVIQPLNIFRLNAGLAAARADKSLTINEIRKKEIEKSIELENIYFGFLYAQQMNRLALKVQKEMDKVLDKMEEALDEDDENVSQLDFLKLKVAYHEVVDGLEQSVLGMKQAKLSASFSLGHKDSENLNIKDSLIFERNTNIPSLDSLKSLLVQYHPDLKRLSAGLKAKKELVHVALGDMAPAFFVMGSFKYAKSWAGDRQNQSDDIFKKDPVNTVEGLIGAGIRYNINVWSTSTKYKKRKLELKHLKLKQNYALKGLMLKLEEKYAKLEKQKRILKSAGNSLRASEAWLKGAAMKYDVDPSEQQELLSAFKANVDIKRKYYKAIYGYNIAVAELFGEVGLTLQEYDSI